MEITSLGNTTLRIQSAQTTALTEPYHPDMPHTSAHIITCSRTTPNPNISALIDGSPRILNSPGEYEIANFYISAIAAPINPPNPQAEPAPPLPDRTINTIFTLRAEGISITHLGSLTQPLTPSQIQKLNQPELLAIDCSGSIIDTQTAAQIINRINPRIVIPLAHDSNPGSLADLHNQLRIQEAPPQPKLTITATSLPRETSIITLRPRL